MRDYAFGNMVTALRTKRGFSQFQLGKLLGVSDKAVSKWENGNAKPRLSTCYRLADILGVSLSELLSPSDASPISSDTAASETAEDSRKMEEKPVNSRMDLAPVRRAELHMRTGMSMSDGVGDVQALLKRAADWGMPAVAVTDFCSTRAFPLTLSAPHRPGKVIYGCEGFMIPTAGAPVEDGCHVMLLAQSREGLVHLNHLISLSSTAYLSSLPCMPKDILLQHRKGLLLGSSCEDGELVRLLRAGASWDELKACADFYDYMEVQPVENELLPDEDGCSERSVLQERVRQLVRLGSECGKPVAAVSNGRYIDPEDALSRAVLQYHDGIEQAEFQPPYYLRTTNEMLEAFSFLGRAEAERIVIDSPLALANRIEDPIELFPESAGGKHTALPFIPDAEPRLREAALSRAHELYGRTLPDPVAERLQKEFGFISAQEAWTTLEIARMAVARSLQDGYPVGSRGAVGSSLVAYLVGVCRINPLPPHYVCPKCHFTDFVSPPGSLCGADLPEKTCPCCKSRLNRDGFGIPVETFLGADGKRTMDIDLNFSTDIQETIHDAARDYFGADHVFRPGIASVLPKDAADAYAALYGADHGMHPDASGLQHASEQITSAIRNVGQHPGGIFIVPQSHDVNDFTPVQSLSGGSEESFPVSHYDSFSLMDRLLKMDFLGHMTPTMLRLLHQKTGISPDSVPLHDEGVLSLFLSPEALHVKADQILSRTGTNGIPEFGSPYVQDILLEARPASVEDLIRVFGLFHGTGVWENNLDEIIRSRTASVHDVPATRDDITNDLTSRGIPMADAFAISELVRKGKGARIRSMPELEKACEAARLPEWYRSALEKIRYLFPRAHTADYAADSLRLAWYKLYEPEAFYAAWFSVHRDDLEATDLSMEIGQLRKAILSIRMDLLPENPHFYSPEAAHFSRRHAAVLLLLEMRCRGCTLPSE